MAHAFRQQRICSGSLAGGGPGTTAQQSASPTELVKRPRVSVQIDGLSPYSNQLSSNSICQALQQRFDGMAASRNCIKALASSVAFTRIPSEVQPPTTTAQGDAIIAAARSMSATAKSNVSEGQLFDQAAQLHSRIPVGECQNRSRYKPAIEGKGPGRSAKSRHQGSAAKGVPDMAKVHGRGASGRSLQEMFEQSQQRSRSAGGYFFVHMFAVP